MKRERRGSPGARETPAATQVLKRLRTTDHDGHAQQAGGKGSTRKAGVRGETDERENGRRRKRSGSTQMQAARLTDRGMLVNEPELAGHPRRAPR